MERSRVPSNIIKSKMRLKNVRSKELAERLRKYGVSLSEHSLNNKLSRGGFSAEFFFQCMMALGVRELRDEEWEDYE